MCRLAINESSCGSDSRQSLIVSYGASHASCVACQINSVPANELMNWSCNDDTVFCAGIQVLESVNVRKIFLGSVYCKSM